MLDGQRLYLIQARSDLRAYDLLSEAAPCHRIHYLQMVAEKLAKAYFWRQGQAPKRRHNYFVKFLRAVAGRGDVGRAVGIGPNSHWENYVAGTLWLALVIEGMAPAEAGDGPNAEYPWPHEAPAHAPASFHFPLWDEINAPRGRRLLALLRLLLDRFEQYG
ncbi:MAG: hypothetical protein K2X87_06725 [Gemmataceae bacterium]|nr:hypothetical protein [Gemmataceae bacterium]